MRQLFALFFAARVIFVLAFDTDDTDLKLYAQYAMEMAYADRLHVPFYEYHQRYIDSELAAWKKAGGPPLSDAVRVVEYPPLAIGWILIPAVFVPAPPADGVITDALKDAYKRAYRWVMLALDSLLFLIILRTGSRERALLYVVGGGLLYHVLYDRLDLVVGGLMLIALSLLVSTRHVLWSFTALAAAIGFKVVPVAIAPIFLIASIPMALFGWRPLLSRALLLAALCALFFVPFYLAAGEPVLAFLGYHAARGLQIESAPSALLLLLSYVGHEIRVVQGFGSYNLASSLSTLLASVSSVVLPLSLGIASLAFLRRVSRSPRSPHADALGTETFAQRYPRETASWVVLMVLIAMLGAKVLSPQYLLWLVPLVPMVEPDAHRYAGLAKIFLLACLLTTIIFPHYYPSDIARIVINPFLQPEILPPSALGKALIIARNAVLLTLAVMIARPIALRPPTR